ncbi:hypothetical protein BH09PSE4_BH09PSE4_12250 [soil metagenome]
MFKLSSSARPFALLATFGLVATGLTVPAIASAKAITVTVPAAVMKDSSSKLCMPKSTAGKNVDKALPKTLCLTSDGWAAMGVTIVTK